MSSFVRDAIRAGIVAAITSGAAAYALSRLETRRGATAINAVSHIAWGGPPPPHDGRGKRNFVTGAALHLGACLFWAPVFEWLRRTGTGRGRAPVPQAATVAMGAYLTDYHVVPDRLRPGMEAFLSRRSLYAVYAMLAAGFLLSARKAS